MAKAPRKKPAAKPNETQLDLDLRQHPARPDIAASALNGRVTAKTFVDPREMITRAPSSPMKSAPEPEAALTSVMLFGEGFDVYETKNGWSWGQSRRDGYVGYLPEAALGEPGAAVTHRVALPQIHLYARPEIKSEPAGLLCLGALVTVQAQEGRFSLIEGGLYALTEHLEGIVKAVRDHTGTAQMLLHAPYLWGGRTIQGVDCSGLVQLALHRAGHQCPRDSDQQEATLGTKVNKSGPLKRGDLVFWPGHVGIMTGKTSLIHANQHHMRVTVEPLADVRARIRKNDGNGISAVRRLSHA